VVLNMMGKICLRVRKSCSLQPNVSKETPSRAFKRLPLHVQEHILISMQPVQCFIMISYDNWGQNAGIRYLLL